MTSAATLRWGVLGAARIAETAVIPAIQAAGGTVAVLASRDGQRARALARLFGIPQVVGRYQEALEAEIDAVYIPLPNSLHLPWSLAALEQGKHVLCEKPLTLTVAEAEQLQTAAERSGLLVAEAVMYRYHPRWAEIHSLLQNGAIGELRHLLGSFTFQLRPPPEVRWQRELGGGALYDVGSYLINAFRWLTSAEPAAVVSHFEELHGVDRSAAFLLAFQDQGVTAQGICSFGAAEHQLLEMVGSRGSLTIPQPFTAWRGEEIPIWLRRGDGTGPERVPTPAADPYLEMVRSFQDAARAGLPSRTSVADAAGTIAVIEACQRSAAGGSWQASR